ncbi:hypothetical protein PIB30_080107 [Stylosanthes scabra]|uniref:RPW8 domain-containing protein n=1 Tax=Stylosanthes scabra TaxID=79078 RepID=A0ABU6UTZ3_9FABA|nr:hypothetical protein [Stylosanthes scabra]
MSSTAAVMGVLLRAAIETVNKGREFKPTLENNMETLNTIAPQVDEMRYNDQLGRPGQEIERLQSRVPEGKELVLLKVAEIFDILGKEDSGKFKGKLIKGSSGAP